MVVLLIAKLKSPPQFTAHANVLIKWLNDSEKSNLEREKKKNENRRILEHMSF